MKFIKLFICTGLLVLASCAKSPADKIVSLYEDTAKQINKASSAEEFIEISRNFLIECDKFDSDPDFSCGEPTEADEKRIEKATDKLQKAVEKASERFNVNLDNVW